MSITSLSVSPNLTAFSLSAVFHFPMFFTFAADLISLMSAIVSLSRLLISQFLSSPNPFNSHFVTTLFIILQIYVAQSPQHPSSACPNLANTALGYSSDSICPLSENRHPTFAVQAKGTLATHVPLARFVVVAPCVSSNRRIAVAGYTPARASGCVHVSD